MRRTVQPAIRNLTLPVALLVLWWATAPAATAPRSIVVFDFELIDSSLEGAVNGPRADEQARLKDVSERLRRRLAESGQVALADVPPAAAEAGASNLQSCGGCDRRLARKVGAELALTGTVQKVSNLILSMNVYVRDVATGEAVAAASADFRGNTDESWTRALDWLLRNRLLTPDGLVK